MSNFTDGLGRPIPEDYFENEASPVEPKLSEDGRAQLDEMMKKIVAEAMKLRRGSSEPD